MARSIREDYLYQDSFDPFDAFTTNEKQYQMLKTILALYEEGLKLVDREEFDFSAIEDLAVLQKVARIKEIDITNEGATPFESLRGEIQKAFAAL